MADTETPPFDPFELVEALIREQCPPATVRAYAYMWIDFHDCCATPLDVALATLLVFAERLRGAGRIGTTAVGLWNHLPVWEDIPPTAEADALRNRVRQSLEVAGRFDFRSPDWQVLWDLCQSLCEDENLRPALRALYYAAYEFISTGDEARADIADRVLGHLGDVLDLSYTP